MVPKMKLEKCSTLQMFSYDIRSNIEESHDNCGVIFLFKIFLIGFIAYYMKKFYPNSTYMHRQRINVTKESFFSADVLIILIIFVVGLFLFLIYYAYFLRVMLAQNFYMFYDRNSVKNRK